MASGPVTARVAAFALCCAVLVGLSSAASHHWTPYAKRASAAGTVRAVRGILNPHGHFRHRFKAVSSEVCPKFNFPQGGKCASGPGSFCSGLDGCKKWCCCACSWDRSAWGDAVCDNSINDPEDKQTGKKMIGDTKTLKELSKAIKKPKVLTALSGKWATDEVVAGLQKLDDQMGADPALQKYRVAVKSCWRSVRSNTDQVCGLVFKTMHMEKIVNPNDEQKGKLKDALARSASVWGLAWPGPHPHASGHGCDLVLMDKAGGQECFDWRAGVAGPPKCSIDAKTAVNTLTDAVAKAGGVRLNYEAWHFEWGIKAGGTSCRCDSSTACNKWPLDGSAKC